MLTASPIARSDDRPLDVRGFEVASHVVSATTRDDLRSVFDRLVGAAPGNRQGLGDPVVRAIASSLAIRDLVAPVLGPHAFAYRATLFDKTPITNWLVAWHQDLVVPVAERRDVPGYGPWSQKGGTWFVQPPVEVLRGLLAVRIDLDGSDATNGALRVLPGTHRLGVLPPARLAEVAATVAPVTCAVPAGGALLMRPLLLHASSKAATATHRRVVHIEFAAVELPAGLAFAPAQPPPDGPDAQGRRRKWTGLGEGTASNRGR